MTYLGKTQRIVFLLTIFVVLLTSCKGKVETSENSDELFSSVFESMAENGESEDNSQNSTDESLEDNGVIDVSFVSSGGGYVSGSVKQSLLEGEVTKSVTAHPSLCYKFKEWSDGVTEQTRSKETFDKDTVLTAVFEYTGLPELYIEYKGGISKYGPRKATYTMKNASGLYEFDSLSGVIQGRGNSSWNHAKKPYKIKFDEAVNMLGIGQKAKRDWVILGNHGDQSLLRNYYAFNLAYKAGIGYKSTLIEVYLNGKYNGVYLLTGKVEESRLNVDEKNGGFLIELDEYASGRENVNYFVVGRERYTLKSDYIDSKQMKSIKSCITEIEEAIRNEDEEKIKELVDIDSCIDMYLLQEYVKNTDVGWSSFYMYKRDGKDKLRFGPAWDFDIAMGNDYRLDKGSYENIYVGRYSGFYQQSWWYIYLCRMEWFRDLALKRWNTSFYSYAEETMNDMKEYAKLNWEELENNFERWKIFGRKINSEPKQIRALRSYLEHYRYFTAWIELRLEWLDECFNDSDFWLKEINDRTYPQYKGGKIPEIEKDPNAPELPSYEEPSSKPVPPIDESSEEPSEEPVPPIDESSEEPSSEQVPPIDESSEEPSSEQYPSTDETSEEPSSEQYPPTDETSEEPSSEQYPSTDESSEEPSSEQASPTDESFGEATEEASKELLDEKGPSDKKPKPNRK